jgi:formate hydrogenlyase subunit 3/multisubunit Na+/H+ antiporter MnhD subunit
MNAPLVLLGLTGGLAIALVLLRRQATASWVVASAGAALVSLLIFFVRVDGGPGLPGLPVTIVGTWTVLGRSLELGAANRAVVGFVYLVTAFMFAGAKVARPGRLFYSAGLLVVGLVAASLMAVPFLYAAVFLEGMALVAVLVLYPPERRGARAPLRMVVLYTLGMMALLAAGWQAEGLGSASASPEAARTATVLAVVGFGLLLAAPPFHLWFPSAAGHSHPYALSFVILISQAGALFLVLRFFDAYAWLRENEALFVGARWVAIGIAVFASLWAMAQRSLARTAVYAVMADTAVILLAFSGMSPAGYQLALGLSAARVIGLGVWGLGASVLQNAGAGDTTEELSGIAYAAPLATAATIIGLFSVAGFPITAGFPGRWAIMAGGGAAAFAVVGAIGAVSLAAIRWTSTVLRSPREMSLPPLALLDRFFLGVGILLCVLLGLFPQLLYPWVVGALTGLSGLAGG